MYVSDQQFEFAILILAFIALHLVATWIVNKLISRKLDPKGDPLLEPLKLEFKKAERTERITFYIRRNGFIRYRGMVLRLLDLGRSFISWGGRGTVHLNFDSTFVIAAGAEETEVKRLVESSWLFKRYREFPESGVTMYYIRWKLWFVWRLYSSRNGKPDSSAGSQGTDSRD